MHKYPSLFDFALDCAYKGLYVVPKPVLILLESLVTVNKLLIELVGKLTQLVFHDPYFLA